MNQSFLRKFSVAGPEGDGRQAYLNKDGVFLGRGVPLLERDAQGRWKPRDAAILAPLLAKGYGVPVALDRRERQLLYLAEALNKGDLALAGVSLVHLELPPLPSDDHALTMAQADGQLIKFNPHWDRERRDPKGETTGGHWTSDGGGASAATAPSMCGDQSGGGLEQQVALQEDPTQARKRRFVEAHLEDAQKAADELHVPVENILGLSVLESGWGEQPLPRATNNYFGIHYPSPRAIGFVESKKPPHSKVSKFVSYGDGAKEFAERFAHIVGGVKDPEQFASRLQQQAKFGINADGTLVSDYPKRVAATIRSLGKLVSIYRIQHEI
jgi:hypothetical protein